MLFISFYSGLKETSPDTDICACLNICACGSTAYAKFALINQSIRGCCLWKDTQTESLTSFCHAGERYTSERAAEARWRERAR